MNPQGELLKEVTIAVSLYKESLDELDDAMIVCDINDTIVKKVHDAREHMFSFLDTPQYENNLC